MADESWNHAFDLMHFLKAHEGRYGMILQGAMFSIAFADEAAARTFHALLAKAMEEADGRESPR